MINKDVKQTVSEITYAHRVNVATFLAAMSFYFLTFYKAYAPIYFLFAWLLLSVVFILIVGVTLVTKYAGKYLIRTGATLLIAYFSGGLANKLLAKMEVPDVAILVTLTMLGFVVWGFVISILFLFRKKWLIYTINILNGLLLIAPIVVVIVGASKDNIYLKAIGILTVVPMGFLFVYVFNRFNVKVDDILTEYTLAAVLEFIILVIIGLALASEDGSVLEFLECLNPLESTYSE